MRTPALLLFLTVSACGDDDPGVVTPDADTVPGCELIANTTATTVEAPSGCAVLARDTSACAAERTAAGLDGVWLDFSCRVDLTAQGADVVAVSDGLPDTLSNYFAASDDCWEAYPDGMQNPNQIATRSYAVTFPGAPTTTETSMMMTGVVGLAVNGVPIYGNFAAPGDDIFEEALTFDRCAGHPQMAGAYHYHSEPWSISYDDANLVGVLRDGYALYGRQDADGTYPALDEFGGHTGPTPHRATDVYHYHVNEQISTGTNTAGERQWFLTTGTFRGTPGACTGC